MDCVKCYEVASMVIQDAAKRFSPLWIIDEGDLDIFKQYCSAIDRLAAEFDGESFEVEVDEESMKIMISLECDEVLVTSKEHVFYSLLKRTEEFSFSVSENGHLLVKFVFPPLWHKS